MVSFRLRQDYKCASYVMWLIMISVAWLAGATSGIPCEEARMKCAYRGGCGMALQNYLVGCSAVLQGDEFRHRCPEICQYSLTALTSTDEGHEFMKCECSDTYCEEQKHRTDICKPAVLHFMNSPVIPCRVAQWICMADTLCSKALEYYNKYCKAMFHGKKCTLRCNNSINILRKQTKAEKLKTCKCDGFEDFDCYGIQRNMDKLCFHKHSRHHNRTHHGYKEEEDEEEESFHRIHKEEEPIVILASNGLKLSISWIALFCMVTVLVT